MNMFSVLLLRWKSDFYMTERNVGRKNRIDMNLRICVLLFRFMEILLFVSILGLTSHE